MARFLVKASEFKNVCKAINDRKLAELKKEIIEILKKQDEKEFKKAIDLFESQEFHYTHLEKSIAGKWIQKAGYGVGTVRIWKGKKYKKIAPGKWARVFDKEGRGTNIAIGKLIAKVQKIDNVEDLMAFVMQNKQRFVDENGIDLPVLDKLRAAVDAKNNGDMGSKTTSKPAEKKEKPAEKKTVDYSKMSEDELEELTSKLHDKLREKNYDEVDEEMEQINAISKQQAINFYKTREKHTLQHVEDVEQKKKMIADSKAVTEKELARKEKQKAKETNIAKKNKLVDEVKELKHKISAFEQIAKELESEAEKTQNRSEAMKGNKNAYKGKLEEISQKLRNAKSYEESDLRKEKLQLEKDFLQNDKKGFDEYSKEQAEKKFNDLNFSKYSKEQLTDYINNTIKYNMDIMQRHIDNESYESGMDKSDYEHSFEMLKNEKAVFEDKLKKLSDSKSTEKEPKETPKEEKPVRTYNIDNSGKAISYDELKPIATNKSVGENEVQMPYSKDLAEELETLKNCVSKDNSRQWMQHVYYEDGNLVATDGRRLKVVKVGELEGIPEGSYVDINTDKSGISIKKRDMVGNFPNYKRVIPDNLNQSVKLDTKLVKDKIKEMRKDGAIDKKGANLVQLEFRDGKVFIDDVAVGEAKDIRLKSSRDWGETTEETKFVNFNADYLVNALSGKTSILQMGDRGDKAMAINTGSTSNIVMPMSGDGEKIDYSGNRKARDSENEAKDKKKADNRKYNESKIKEYTPKNVNININDMKNRMKEMSDEELKRNYDMLTFNLDKVMDKKMFTTGSVKVDSKLGLDLAHAVAYKAIVEKYPEVKEIVSAELESRGISVKKSLFDDFVMDMFIDEDEEEIEEDKEEESLFNDYSAEQPELFNSTEMKVQEAYNRCGCSL